MEQGGIKGRGEHLFIYMYKDRGKCALQIDITLSIQIKKIKYMPNFSKPTKIHA
jgi:hypothetical protein